MPRSSSRASSPNGSQERATPATVARDSGHEPDVYLSVPDLHVDEIRLDVENLEAHLALQARLANLLDLRAGAHVIIEKVDVDIKGVAAKAMLKVRLENVYAILDRTLTSIDRNPRILEGVIDTVDRTLSSEGVLGDTIEGVGRTVRSVGNGGTRLARLGAGVRRLGQRPRRVRLATKVATAAGALGGAALVAHGNGGIEKTLKELAP